MMNLQRTTLAAFSSMLLLFTAACSSGGGDTLSGPEYFTELQSLDDASEVSQEQLQSAYDSATASIPEGSASEARLTAERVFYEGLVQIGKDYVNAIDDLVPPAEVKDAHEEYIAAYDEVLIQLNTVVDDLPAVTTVGGLNALLSNDDLVASFTRANKACVELQASALTVDARVDLECKT